MQPFTFFVSYRRKDTAPIALLLKNEIEKRFQFVRVSVDVEEMRPGEKFPDRIKRLIADSHATIALIGENWMPHYGTTPPSNMEYDWVAAELHYSDSEPLTKPQIDRFKLAKREIIPIFVNCEPNFAQFEVPSSISFLHDLHSERIDYASWPRSIGPLLETIAERLDLRKRLDTDELPHPHPSKARTETLVDEELAKILSYDDYHGWYVDNFGHAEVRYLVKKFSFQDFNQAADFMELVSNHCRILDHHPEWRNVFKHVTVILTTWDAGRKVTIYDLSLALYMNMAAKTVSKN
jgi:pterin-4a-carbinolamine dehydratase